MVSASTLINVFAFLTYVVAQDDADDGKGIKRYGGPLGYIPSLAPVIIFCLLYALVAVHGTWMMFRFRGRYMATLVTCGYLYALGLVLRIPYRTNTDSLGLYLVLDIFVVLSPCGFIATVYVLLGRLAHHLQAEELMLIRPQLITKLFVSSDILTLLIQGNAAPLAISKSPTTANIGAKIFLVGLILQLISFLVYCVVFGVFLYRLRTWNSPIRHEPMNKGIRSHWKGLVGAMIISCLGITIRSAYRTVEGSQGFDGYLHSHEVYFLVLDTLPLWLAVAVYTIFWPPAILTNIYSSEGHEMVPKEPTGGV